VNADIASLIAGSFNQIPLETLLYLIVGAFAAGLIDAIVGGGGLISVPLFLLALGPNASAIGTNKVAAVAAQLAAFAVYFGNRQVDTSRAHGYFALTAIGAVLGAWIAPKLPSAFFQYFLLVVAPLVLIMVFNKNAWQRPLTAQVRPRLALAGTFAAGLYDGVAGPGGGTLMFLSLYLLGGLPASLAMGTGKLANLGSASSSLATFAAQGEVHWVLGTLAAIPIAIGAWLGARFATRLKQGESAEERARKIARYALVVVSTLLIGRWVISRI
jgi:uncharacterized protein